jgi:hypothetical protein
MVYVAHGLGIYWHVWLHTVCEASKLVGSTPYPFDAIWAQDKSRELQHAACDFVNYCVGIFYWRGVGEGGDIRDVVNSLLRCLSCGFRDVYCCAGTAVGVLLCVLAGAGLFGDGGG